MDKPAKPTITVVIPTKNERDCIGPVLEELPKDVVDEIIVVDANSADGTADYVRELGYRVIQQPGKGYGDAVRTGLAAAASELVTFVDADGSYDPAALTEMLQGIQDGNDFVFCSRYRPESGSDDDTLIRLIGNKLFTFLLRAIHGVRITDSLFLYMLGRKEALDKLDIRSDDFGYCIELPIRVHKAGLKYAEIPSRERPRLAGDSKVNAFTDGLTILKAVLRG